MDQDPSKDTSSESRSLSPWHVWDFAIHVIIGTLVFLIIAGGAVALDVMTAHLEPLGIDRVIRYGLKGAEYALFITDLLLFLIFIAKAGARAIRRL